jgi:hypothetical protein
VKVINRDLQGVLEGLNELMAKEMKPSLSFQIAWLAKKLTEQATLYFEIRNKLINECAEKNEDGSIKFIEGTENVTIPTDKIGEFVALESVEGDEVKPLSLTALEKAGGTTTPIMMLKLRSIILDDLE